MRENDNQRLIEKYKKSYWSVNRSGKTQILNQLEELTDLDRKYINRQLLNHHEMKPLPRPDGHFVSGFQLHKLYSSHFV